MTWRKPATDLPYLLIEGRRWRRSDPGVPEPLRKELVVELMSARRAVAKALREGSHEAERAARSRVQAAKVALGERGAAWWDQPSDEALRTRCECVVRALLSARGEAGQLTRGELAAVLGGTSRRHKAAIEAALNKLAAAGMITAPRPRARIRRAAQR